MRGAGKYDIWFVVLEFVESEVVNNIVASSCISCPVVRRIASHFSFPTLKRACDPSSGLHVSS